MQQKYRKYVSIILTLLIIICIYLLINNKCINEKYNNIYTKNAIVVLTRGYDTIEKYDNLIKRNEAIFDKFYSKQKNIVFDIILFHEGNISSEHQTYIQSKTPNLPLIFTGIQFYNNTIINDMCPPTDVSKQFSNGYKNMCYFWSIDFLEYLKDYNYIIRIDEDCVIEQLDNNIIEKYINNDIKFSSAKYESGDDPSVVIGMNDLFNKFLIKNNLSQKNDLKMPYTNFMVVNIPFFNNNNTIKNILQEIKDTNCIFSNRWGDLPIWGYILSYLVDEKYFIEDKSVVYYHDSHNIKIN